MTCIQCGGSGSGNIRGVVPAPICPCCKGTGKSADVEMATEVAIAQGQKYPGASVGAPCAHEQKQNGGVNPSSV